MLLQSAAANAAEVIVSEPVTRLVPTMKHLRDQCGAAEACTRFVAYRLEASCAPDDSGWRVHASATFKPWILLYNMQHLSHELEHISDIHGFVLDHVNVIEAESFEAQSDCQQRALVAQSGFESVLRAAAMRSNALRH